MVVKCLTPDGFSPPLAVVVGDDDRCRLAEEEEALAAMVEEKVAEMVKGGWDEEVAREVRHSESEPFTVNELNQLSIGGEYAGPKHIVVATAHAAFRYVHVIVT